MSDLPSPKEIDHAYVNDPNSSRLREWAWDCLIARMEGRLVDREAIDYEAAEQAWNDNAAEWREYYALADYPKPAPPWKAVVAAALEVKT